MAKTNVGMFEKCLKTSSGMMMWNKIKSECTSAQETQEKSGTNQSLGMKVVGRIRSLVLLWHFFLQSTIGANLKRLEDGELPPPETAAVLYKFAKMLTPRRFGRLLVVKRIKRTHGNWWSIWVPGRDLLLPNVSTHDPIGRSIDELVSHVYFACLKPHRHSCRATECFWKVFSFGLHGARFQAESFLMVIHSSFNQPLLV